MPSRTAQSLPPCLRLFSAISLAIFLPTWALAVFSIPRRLRYPMLLPFLNDGHSFSDFWVFYPRFLQLHTLRFFATAWPVHFSYFAPAVPLYEAFYSLGRARAFPVYLAFVLLSVLCGAIQLGRSLARAGLRPSSIEVLLATSLVCAFPVIFAVERGNLEIIIAIGVVAGIWAFCTGRLTLAAVLWGLFGAAKLYPLLLAGLFLARRRWLGHLLLTLATAAVTTLLSLKYIGPTFAQATAGMRDGPAEFLADFTLTRRAIAWDHSFFSILKLFEPLRGYNYRPLLLPYLLIAGGTMLALFLLRARRLPLANQLVFFSVAMVLLPPTSFEYTLTELYGAWGVLVWLAADAWSSGQRSVSGLAPALAIMAVLLSPLRLVIFHGRCYGGQLQCLLLLALLAVVLLEPWPALPLEGADESQASLAPAGAQLAIATATL